MELYNEVIGDKGKDMFELVGLATAPKKQGRGYATALVNVLNQMVCARTIISLTLAEQRDRQTRRVKPFGWPPRTRPGSMRP